MTQKSTRLANAYKGVVTRWFFLALIPPTGLGIAVMYTTKELTQNDLAAKLSVFTFISIAGLGLFYILYRLLDGTFRRLDRMLPPSRETGTPTPPTSVHQDGELVGYFATYGGGGGGSNVTE